MFHFVLLILIIIFLAYNFYPRKETMTRIFRGVGVRNEANEIPVAAGIIHSLPLMDYTHTYWDGRRWTSCDECPTAIICPTCPNK